MFAKQKNQGIAARERVVYLYFSFVLPFSSLHINSYREILFYLRFIIFVEDCNNLLTMAPNQLPTVV